MEQSIKRYFLAFGGALIVVMVVIFTQTTLDELVLPKPAVIESKQQPLITNQALVPNHLASPIAIKAAPPAQVLPDPVSKPMISDATSKTIQAQEVVPVYDEQLISSSEATMATLIEQYNGNLSDPDLRKSLENELSQITVDYKQAVLHKVKAINQQ